MSQQGRDGRDQRHVQETAALRVMARAFEDHEVPEDWRASIDQLFVTVEREYRVWAVRVTSTGPYLLIIDDLRHPGLYPGWCFFRMLDGSVPSDWVLAVESDSEGRPVTIVGPHHLASESALGALLDWDPDALMAFWEMIDREHRHEVRSALERLAASGYPGPVADADGVVFNSFELERLAQLYLDSGALDIGAIPEFDAATAGSVERLRSEIDPSGEVAQYLDALIDLRASLVRASVASG